jgi:hypothetical protein
MTARCVMVLGTTSGAGKSWLTTALCRYYARQGLKVAPFKAQNMSNNARVVAGGEIGSAQYFPGAGRARRARCAHEPAAAQARADTHSQVVLMGQVDAELSRMAWRGRSASVWPQIAQALDELRAENDVVVIEGAGSPAEINLHDSDIVNMRVARTCRCALPAGDRHRPRRRLCPPVRHLGAAAREESALDPRALCSTSSGAMPAAGARAADAAGPDRRAHRGHAAHVVAARPARGRRCV